MSDIVERLRNYRNHALTVAERLEAADEIERWRGAAEGSDDERARALADLKSQYDRLRRQADALREALQFYASEESWIEKTVDYGGNFVQVTGSAPANDEGRRARAGLKAAAGEEHKEMDS
jgi:hypothetical protein